MKFEKLVEIKGSLVKGDQITIPGNSSVWTIDGEKGEYFDIVNNDTGDKTMLSKFKLMDVKKFPILEFITQEDKTKEIERYERQVSELKSKMTKFRANAKDGKEYKSLEKQLDRVQTALCVIKKETPRINVY